MSVTPETPQSREEEWLAVIAGIAGIEPEEPQSRIEKWLAVIAGIEGIEPEEPQSRIEKWLAYIAEHGINLTGLPEVDAAIEKQKAE